MSNNEIVPGFDEEEGDGLLLRLERTAGLDGGLVIHVEGFIDPRSVDRFERSATAAVENGYIKLIFDLGGLRYSGEPRFGIFTAFLKAVKPRGGDIVLYNIDPKVFEVFQLLGFSQFFVIRNSLDEAIRFFTEPKRPFEFPADFSCPVCSMRCHVAKPGPFRCTECRAALAIDGMGLVSFDIMHAVEGLDLRFRQIVDLEGGLEIDNIGHLDTYTQPRFRERVLKLIDAGNIKIAFDCSALDYITSNAVGSFTAFLEALGGKGGAMVLVNVQAGVLEVFELLGFAPFFRFAASRGEAIRILKEATPPRTPPARTAVPKEFTCPCCSSHVSSAVSGRQRCPSCGASLRLFASGKVIKW